MSIDGPIQCEHARRTAQGIQDPLCDCSGGHEPGGSGTHPRISETIRIKDQDQEDQETISRPTVSVLALTAGLTREPNQEVQMATAILSVPSVRFSNQLKTPGEVLSVVSRKGGR